MIQFGVYFLKVGNLHSTLEKSGGTIITNRTNFWGVQGVSEIISPGVGPETIESDVWINDPKLFTPNANGLTQLLQYLNFLDSIRGLHGILIQSGTINKIYYNCTFEGFTYTRLEGQERPDPLITPCCDGWIQAGRLTWTTLKYEPPPQS